MLVYPGDEEDWMKKTQVSHCYCRLICRTWVFAQNPYNPHMQDLGFRPKPLAF